MARTGRAAPARDERTIAGRNPLGGATVVNLSPAVAQELGVDPFAAPGGVLVIRLEGGSLAETVGVRPGDLIREVNGRPIKATADLSAALATPAAAWRITLQRGDQQITGQFRL